LLVEPRGPRFQVVDDRLRDEPDEMQELADELLAGRTVFLPGVKNDYVTTLYARFGSRYGRRLRRRSRTVEGTEGFVVWLDPTTQEAAGEESGQ
jgi:hypothetical protein